MIRILLLLIISTSAFGQIDTSKIKITSKGFSDCILAKINSTSRITDNNQLKSKYDEAGNEIVNDEMQTCTDEFHVTYPYFQTKSLNLNKFINDTIQKIAFMEYYNYFVDSNRIKCICNGNGIDERPSEYFTTYKLNFVNSDFISLTINQNYKAGGGGSGNNEFVYPITFDLTSKKILTLRDIINCKYDSLVYEIIIKQLKENYERFIDEERLKNIKTIINHPISIDNNGIKVYWNLSWGRGSGDFDITLEFDKYKNIFQVSLLNKESVN